MNWQRAAFSAIVAGYLIANFSDWASTLYLLTHCNICGESNPLYAPLVFTPLGWFLKLVGEPAVAIGILLGMRYFGFFLSKRLAFPPFRWGWLAMCPALVLVTGELFQAAFSNIQLAFMVIR